MSKPSIDLVEAPPVAALSPISRPHPTARRYTPSRNATKITLAITDEIAAGTSEAALALLTRKEQMRRLNARLLKRGLTAHELPNTRAYRRYFSGH